MSVGDAHIVGPDGGALCGSTAPLRGYTATSQQCADCRAVMASGPSAGAVYVTLDANRIAPKLYLGAVTAAHLAEARHFPVVVLCAQERQPPEVQPQAGIEVICCPIDDCAITPAIAQAAHNAALHVAARLRAGVRCLVTCQAGRNRSGLVAGLALRLNGVDGPTAVQWIQERRRTPFGNGLGNSSFADFVRTFRP